MRAWDWQWLATGACVLGAGLWLTLRLWRWLEGGQRGGCGTCAAAGCEAPPPGKAFVDVVELTVAPPARGTQGPGGNGA
jgi:hypothetical protein